MRALLNSIDDFKNFADAAVVFSIPALLGLAISMLVARPTYFAAGGFFLRTSDLLALDGASLLLAVAASIFSILLISATVILVSLIVKERRTFSRFSSRQMRAALKSNLLPVSFIGITLFSLNFLFQSLSLVVPLLPIYHLILLVVYALLFFAPYALIIDNYSLSTAISKSIEMVAKSPQRFAIWVAVLFSLAFVFHAFSFGILPYRFAEVATFLFTSLVLLPLSIIFGAHLYMDRYPLS